MATPHLTPSVWVEDDVVVIHDRIDRSPGRVPVVDVEPAWKRANGSDRGWAWVWPIDRPRRLYHRDTLRAALDLVENLPACGQCGDPYATRPMGDGVMFCVGCCSGAQGSRFDDRSPL